jgi:hypothetical protein
MHPSSDLTARKTDALTRLDTMRQERGAAMLDGADFDHAAFAAVETELEALTEAEGEQVRRDRNAMARAEAERLNGLRNTLTIVEEQRLDAVDRAEKAARELADALKEVQARSADASKLIRALDAGNAMHLDAYSVELRLSNRLATALKPVTGLRRRFGQIVFPEAQNAYYSPWRAAEQAIAAPDLSRAKGDKQ